MNTSQREGLESLVKRKGICLGVCECRYCLIQTTCRPSNNKNIRPLVNHSFIELRYKLAMEILVREFGKDYVVELLI